MCQAGVPEACSPWVEWIQIPVFPARESSCCLWSRDTVLRDQPASSLSEAWHSVTGRTRGDTASLDTPSRSPRWSQGMRTGDSRYPGCFSHLQRIPSTCHQRDPLTHCPHQCFHPMSEVEGPSCHGMLEGLRHLEHEGGGRDGTGACPPPLLHLPEGRDGVGWLFQEAALLLSSCCLSSPPQQLFPALPRETSGGAIKVGSRRLEQRHGSTTQC